MTPELPGELIADCSDGFIQIPNLLFEALMAARLNATQKDICDYIVRLTYGWSQEEAAISLNEFTLAFNVDRKWILSQLGDLVRKKIIIKTCCLEDNKSVWKINTNLHEWDPRILNPDQLRSMKKTNASAIFRQQNLWNVSPDSDAELSIDNQTPAATENNVSGVVVNTPPEAVVNSPPGVVVNSPPGVVVNTPPPDPALFLEEPQLQTSLNTNINTILNTNINTKKNKPNRYSENSVSYSLAKFLLDKIHMNYPERKEPDLQQWALYIDRMIKYDKRNPETVKKVIIFAQEDDFWIPNILCAKTLRKHFDRLDAQRLKREKDRARYKKEVADKDEYDFFFTRKT